MYLGDILTEVIAKCKPHSGWKLIEHRKDTWVIG
jgi:hypothetical protein